MIAKVPYVQNAEIDYNKPSKFHWRNWWWNRIAERLVERFDGSRRSLPTKLEIRNACKTATVLYLLGDKGGDYEAAIRGGFVAHNLIGVDTDKKCVSIARRKGRLAIHADLLDLLYVWPGDFPVSVVSADMCCGCNAKVMELILLPWGSECLRNGSVFAINVARGQPGERIGNWKKYVQFMGEMKIRDPDFGRHV